MEDGFDMITGIWEDWMETPHSEDYDLDVAAGGYRRTKTKADWWREIQRRRDYDSCWAIYDEKEGKNE